jgi:hypothetical protein
MSAMAGSRWSSEIPSTNALIPIVYLLRKKLESHHKRERTRIFQDANSFRRSPGVDVAIMREGARAAMACGRNLASLVVGFRKTRYIFTAICDSYRHVHNPGVAAALGPISGSLGGQDDG